MSTTPVGRIQRPAPKWTLGDRIRKARRDVDMSQAQFASLLGVGAKALAAWETDYNRPADLVELAERLEAVTGIPRSWFLGWGDGGPGLNSDWKSLRSREPSRMRSVPSQHPSLRVIRSDRVPATRCDAA
jgi:transcriptional regulator with XRE-family HTH domain